MDDILSQYESVKGALARLEDEVYDLGGLLRPRLKEEDDEESLDSIYTKLNELESDLSSIMYVIG